MEKRSAGKGLKQRKLTKVIVSVIAVLFVVVLTLIPALSLKTQDMNKLQ